MDNQRKDRNGDKKKEIKPGKEKDWDNPKDPEGTEDQRDVEQVERQIEEAKRRKENLTNDDNENH